MERCIKITGLLFIVAGLTVLGACGGGGGGGGGGGSKPTSAKLIISASGSLAPGTSISGIGLTVLLPNGVKVKTDTGGIVDSTVAVPSGAASGHASVLAIYTAATSTLRARLDLATASTTTAGFGAGEFLTVNCTVSSGTPTAGGFSITDFAPVDLLSKDIAGLTPGFTADIR